MNYYINGNIVKIDTSKKPYDKGSEGKLYKFGSNLYKIYFPHARNEGFGSKERYHSYLKNITTEQVILPSSLIYDENGEYVGYVTPEVDNDRKNQNGIIKLSKQEIINNLQILENDFSILSQKFVLVSDVASYNYIFGKDRKMYIIDPGRYRSFCFDDRTLYEKDNYQQLDSLIGLLIYNDLVKYKVSTKRKIQVFKDTMKSIKEDTKYSDFFSRELEDDETILDYALKKIRYIK